MSDLPTLVAHHDRAFLEAWLTGADFPMAPTVRRLLAAHDALAARLAATEEALREIERIAANHEGVEALAGEPS